MAPSLGLSQHLWSGLWSQSWVQIMALSVRGVITALAFCGKTSLFLRDIRVEVCRGEV